MGNKFDKLFLWVCRHFHVEKKAIPHLQGIRPEDIKEGKMYEWWGRIVKPVQNPKNVEISYIVYPDPNASTKAIDLLVNNSDKLVVLGDKYKISDDALAEELRNAGIFVEDMIKNEPCKQCYMHEKGLPCPECNFKHYWKLVATYQQNCTDQEAWSRAMIKRITK